MALDLRLDGREFDSQPPRLVLGLVTVFGQINHLGISPSRYRPTQPPTLRRTGNEYLPKCGDALRLVSKGWLISLVDKRVMDGWLVKLCEPSLTRANQGSICEMSGTGVGFRIQKIKV